MYIIIMSSMYIGQVALLFTVLVEIGKTFSVFHPLYIFLVYLP